MVLLTIALLSQLGVSSDTCSISDLLPSIALRLPPVDGICETRNDTAYQSSVVFPPTEQPQLNESELQTDLRDQFCILMLVNVNSTNEGPLFVAYGSSGELGRLVITSDAITLELYGVTATFYGDFTGSYRQLSICVHDGQADLNENCFPQQTANFVVDTTDRITHISFGQTLIGNSLPFQGAVQQLVFLGCFEPAAQCISIPQQCTFAITPLSKVLETLGSPTAAPGIRGSGEPTAQPVPSIKGEKGDKGEPGDIICGIWQFW